MALYGERNNCKKRSRCDILHRLSYEKDLYKKVRIHCVSGRTLPFGKAMKKIIEKLSLIHI